MSRKPSALTSALNNSNNKLGSSSGSGSEPSAHSRPSNGVTVTPRVPRSAFPCLFSSAGEQADEFSTDVDDDALDFSRLSLSSARPDSLAANRRPSSVVSAG